MQIIITIIGLGILVRKFDNIDSTIERTAMHRRYSFIHKQTTECWITRPPCSCFSRVVPVRDDGDPRTNVNDATWGAWRATLSSQLNTTFCAEILQIGLVLKLLRYSLDFFTKVTTGLLQSKTEIFRLTFSGRENYSLPNSRSKR